MGMILPRAVAAVIAGRLLVLLVLLLLPLLPWDKDFLVELGGPSCCCFLSSAGNASQCEADPWPSGPLAAALLGRNVGGTTCGRGFSDGDSDERTGAGTRQAFGTSRGGTTRAGPWQAEGAEMGAEGADERLSEEGREQKETVRVVGGVADEYIVRFRDYRYASAHQRALEQALGRAGWLWVERKNPATAFPTDFGLLRIRSGRREQLLGQLAGVSFVRDVSPQMQFTRALASEDNQDSERENSQPEFARHRSGPKEGGRKAGVHRNRTHKKASRTERDGLDSAGVGQCHASQGKPDGRLRTSISFEDSQELKWETSPRNTSLDNRVRSLLGMERSQITSMFEAEKLWAKGYTGSKVKMAVFDTGVRADHPHFRNIKERTNWTNEKDVLNDNLGHGTFVAGVISSQDPQCLGFAPDAEIYAFRVFTDAQVSYTSWFLDAFNYAIATSMNVLNLSIGGPDYLDSPFVEKVWEMTANNIIMVSAIGNDGPLYGTLNNPADQSDVIGVGGIDYSDHIASFSSRGMSTWELPHGYGRVKPDIVAYGREVIGSKITTGCKSLSGTSVASPVVAGAVCLLASVVPEDIRWDVLNPASMKQALVEGAIQLVGPNIYEQGAGRLDLLKSFEILLDYRPRASIHPRMLDLTGCPYMWPFCRQPLYYGAMPIIFNATILNGMGVVGYIESSPTWTPFGDAGHLLDIQYVYSDVIWPWTGYIGLHFRIKPEGSEFSGTLEGNISFTVTSPPGRGEETPRIWDCNLPVKVVVVPTPLREKRILWDQFHSVRYPPGYIPRDSLDVRNDILDWHGDHIHTNFHGMFDNLRDAGYFLETLGSPLTCFDAEQYGTLLMVDLEDEYYEEEIEKLKDDVETRGLGLIVFADWYHLDTMVKMRFFDDNTRSWWTPATGGANIPALNDLLAPFGIAFGDTILNGVYSIGSERARYASGTDIRKFPAGGFVHRFLFLDSSGGNSGITLTRTGVKAQVELPILGALEVGKGRIAVYGDSNCLDSSHMVTNCYWLLKKLLDFTSYKIQDSLIFPQTNELSVPIGAQDVILPVRRTDVNFSTYSLVLGHPLRCGMDAPIVVQGLKGFLAQTETSRNRIHTDRPTGTGFMSRDLADNKESMVSLLAGSSSAINASSVHALVGGEVEPEMTQPHLSSDNVEDSFVQIDGLTSNNTVSQEILGELNEMHSEDFLNSDRGVEKEESMLDGHHQIEGIIDMIGSRKTKKEIGFGIGWRREELDSTAMVFQWLAPVTLCVTGFLLIWSLWRVRQKKRRRVKKGSTRSLLSL